jgi:hypothetical protein
VELIVNLSNPPEKGMLLDKIRGMDGSYRLEIVKHRKRRSDRQNRYYWGAFMQPFADYLSAQGETVTADEVHSMFKAKFLRSTVIDRKTGEAIGVKVKSTAELSTEEFNEYLDKVGMWLSERGFQVPEPEVYREAG